MRISFSRCCRHGFISSARLRRTPSRLTRRQSLAIQPAILWSTSPDFAACLLRRATRRQHPRHLVRHRLYLLHDLFTPKFTPAIYSRNLPPFNHFISPYSVTIYNTPGVIRTRDRRIRNHSLPHSNPLNDKELTSIPDSRCSAGRSDERDEGGIADPELARVAAAWPTLPKNLKAAVLALIDAV